MAKKSDYQRYEKYRTKFSGERIPAVVGTKEATPNTTQIPLVLAKMRDVVHVQQQLETMVKAILADAACYSYQNPFYIGYARACKKLCQSLSGGTLKKEADALLEKWVGRGLDIDTLEKIRNGVLTLSSPV
jgi:hypothetical protein